MSGNRITILLERLYPTSTRIAANTYGDVYATIGHIERWESCYRSKIRSRSDFFTTKITTTIPIIYGKNWVESLPILFEVSKNSDEIEHFRMHTYEEDCQNAQNTMEKQQEQIEKYEKQQEVNALKIG